MLVLMASLRRPFIKVADFARISEGALGGIGGFRRGVTLGPADTPKRSNCAVPAQTLRNVGFDKLI